MPRVIIVGGGIAGLVMARDLVLGGCEVTVLEASNRLGGKVARHTVGGLELDAGAESFATRNNTVADLARQLGLGEAIVGPNSQGAWLQKADGTAFPLPKTGILGIPSTPLAADVIAVIGFWAALRGQLDGLLFGFLGAKQRNLGKLVRARMGRGVLERLVAPVALAIHSRHPNELDVDLVAPGLRAAMIATGSLAHGVRALRLAASAGTAVGGIVGGMFELVRCLERDLHRFGVTVRLGAAVTAVTETTVTLGDGQQLEADRVVLATSLATNGDAPAARAPAERPVASVPEIVLVTLVVDAAGLDSAPRGTGVLVVKQQPADLNRSGLGPKAKALTHATAKWDWLAGLAADHRHVIRLSYDGALVASLTDDRLREQALADAQLLLGVSLAVASVVGFARVGWMLPAAAGEKPAGVTVIGESSSGTGLTAVIADVRVRSAYLLEDLER